LGNLYADELSEKLEKIYQFARNRLKLSNDRMKRYNDMGTKMQNFKITNVLYWIDYWVI
jgi:hypothetical protein